jgi:hypothetical protein
MDRALILKNADIFGRGVESGELLRAKALYCPGGKDRGLSGDNVENATERMSWIYREIR